MMLLLPTLITPWALSSTAFSQVSVAFRTIVATQHRQHVSLGSCHLPPPVLPEPLPASR